MSTAQKENGPEGPSPESSVTTDTDILRDVKQGMRAADARDLALRLAAAGFPVFPIGLRWDAVEKKVKKETLNSHDDEFVHGHLDASTDPDVIERMFRKAKMKTRCHWGVGLVPGGADRLVFDVDKKNGGRGFESLATIEAEFGTLPGRRIRTPSGGLHIYERIPPGTAIGQAKVWEGIDLRSDKGWVVAPGVTSPWGAWEPESGETGDAPPGLLERILTHLASAGPLPESVGPNDRHTTLVSLAGTLRNRGASATVILAALRAYNSEHCHPPKPDGELVDIANWAATKESKKGKPHRDDTANADLLAQLHGARIRYVANWNEFLVWAGTHWARDTRGVLIGELAKDVGRILLAEAADIDNADQRKTALNFAHQTLGAGRIHHMIELVRGIGKIPLEHELLDTDPWLLGVRNGVVDLRTGQFREADPADLMTMQCPVDWDDTARCPRWEAALEEWFPNADTRAYVRRLVGQALVGAQRDHVFVIHYGPGANGKGTLVRGLQHVLGPYSATPDLALLTETKWGPHATATADLFRSRLAVASETERRVKLAEASIKNLTGNDRIRARRLYENPWKFTPSHSLWLITNYQPQITGRDAGIWRRIRVVPWVATFDNGTADPDLDEKLKAEAPGILRWAVAGVAEWLVHGLDEPDEVIRATATYRTAEDLLGRFASDVGLVFDRHLTIGKGELSDLFVRWNDDEGLRLPKAALRDWLTGEHGCGEDIAREETPEGERRQVRIWRGAGLRPENPETQSEQGKSPDGVTSVTSRPETPIGTPLHRDFTEDLSHLSQTACGECGHRIPGQHFDGCSALDAEEEASPPRSCDFCQHPIPGAHRPDCPAVKQEDDDWRLTSFGGRP